MKSQKPKTPFKKNANNNSKDTNKQIIKSKEISVTECDRKKKKQNGKINITIESARDMTITCWLKTRSKITFNRF